VHSAGEVTARPSRGLSTICSAYLIFMADPRTVRLFAQSIKARNPLLLSVTGTTDRSPPSPLVSELAPYILQLGCRVCQQITVDRRATPAPHALHRWRRISETLVAVHGDPPRFASPPHRSQETLRAVLDPPNRYQETRSSLSWNTVQPRV